MSFSFSDHIVLLGQFLAGRSQIAGEIDRRLLSGRGKTLAQTSDRGVLDDIFISCFFESTAVPRQAGRLKGQLAATHLVEGFEPSADGPHSELDPMGLLLYAHQAWENDRWPGRHGRLAYAQSLYAAFMLRQLGHLSLRIWDDGDQMAPEHLKEIQHLLDALNAVPSAPLVRDARWLIQIAQGPLTKHLKPYFVVADRVAGSFSDRDRREIHTAGAALAGGHLRSQLRHRSWQTGWSFDDRRVLALTHLSNSMDLALLVRDLVPLLEAYSHAALKSDGNERLALADAILQGLSADPELLLIRLDLLGPATMIEDLFVARDHDGDARETPASRAHRECLRRYAELVGRTAASLRSDALSLDPGHAVYSPLGIVYGFCADLLSNMVLSTLRAQPSTELALEDIFNSRGQLELKQAQANEWQRLPGNKGERDPFEHSTEWAGRMFTRMMAALEARAARPTKPNASAFTYSRLHVAPRATTLASASEVGPGLVSAQEHCLTTDTVRAAKTGATALPITRLSADRAEGRFLASAESDGELFCVSKAVLTIYLSQGRDALITDVPRAVIDVLQLSCPDLIVVE